MASHHFEIGVQAARSGDDARAYRYIRAAILDDPTFAPAWYWMSQVVSDYQRKRECIDRAKALDPTLRTVREDFEFRRLRTLIKSFHSPIFAERYRPEPRKLGEFLIDQGYLTVEQLKNALAEQQAERKQGWNIQLGRILLRKKLVTPLILATTLIEQRKVLGGPPEHLGEYLVSHHLITIEQLKIGMAEQMLLALRGEHLKLGELLVRDGVLRNTDLERMLEEQRLDAMKHFR